MSDFSSASLLSLFIFLVTPFFFGYIARQLKLSPIIGYIIGGLVLSIFFKDAEKSIINDVAFWGIVLLLFTVGLEVNFKHLLRLKKYIITGGLLQIAITVGITFILALLFHFTFLTSLLIAFACSSSSTILVAKIIQDKGEESTFVGEIALGLLMMQDLAFIPFLIIVQSLNVHSLNMGDVIFDILFSLIKSALIISLMFIIGQRIIPKAFDHIARYSRELLNLFVILFIICITYISTLLNIPILLGVFVAGILLGQTYEHHQIFSQIRPIRDLLAVVFFVYIGLNINILQIGHLLPGIILFSILVSLIKIAIVLGIFIKLKLHSRSAFSLSLFTFQISEGSFILMHSAFKNGVISHQDYLFIITSILTTLIMTPVIINYKDTIYLTIKKFVERRIPQLANFINKTIDRDIDSMDEIQLEKHIIICGYGRMGHQIGKALNMAHIPFIAIDSNFHVVEKIKQQGINIIYGDPTDIDILEYAKVKKALILIVALPEKFSQEVIVLNTQKLNPKITIISRVHQDIDAQRLIGLGVNLVVQPEFEASIAIIRKLLYAFNHSQEEIAGHIKRIKMEHGMA